MKRIRQALARISRVRKPAVELTSKAVSTDSVTTSTTRPSYDNDDGIGALILYDGTNSTQNGDDGIDIVFVHCLGGNRIRSWQKDGVCWPRDLLAREIPAARIITWGWKIPDLNRSSIDQYTYTQLISMVGEGLIADISKVCKEPDRDIIFVTHGIGGMVVKDVLSTAATSQVFGKHTELGNIYPKTAGIVFLGVPHGGNGRQPFADAIVVAAQIEASRQHEAFFQLIRENSELFESHREEFILVSRDIHVVCARELLPTSAGIMVPKASAFYEGFNVTVDDIFADHIDIARFATRQDPGYFQLVGHISKLSQHAKIEDTEAKLVRGREILETLNFDMRDKEDASHDAYKETCSWILSAKESDESASAFHEWLQSTGSIFWVSGNAGSGKTTLMKYAFHNPKTRQFLEHWADGGELIIAAVFLFEGGSHIQRSREGILRAMLFQILSARPDLIPVCFPSFMRGPWPPPLPFNTTVNLSQAFYQLFARMSKTLRLCMFIDGLDEYRVANQEDSGTDSDTLTSVSTAKDGGTILGSSKWIANSHDEIARLIMDLANQDHVKLCVSSRELSPFTEAFAEAPRLRVHFQTQKFISQYCANRLDNVSPGLSAGQASLCNDVARKSRGDILWARLAIDILMEGSFKKLKATLDSLPTHLGGSNGLYMHMVQSLPPAQKRAACRIFHIIHKAQDPPSLITLAFAEEGYLAGPKQQQANPGLGELIVKHDRAHPFTSEDLQGIADRMKQRLVTCCAGLLEAPDKSQRVVFTHMTAKEFILGANVWNEVLVSPPNKIEVYFSLISGTLRYLRCFGTLNPIMTKWSDFHFNPDAWLLVAHVLRYAARIGDEPFDPKAYCELLDELDRICHESWIAAVKAYVPRVDESGWYNDKFPMLSSSHWTGFEPMELGQSPKRDDFLSLAVQANLFSYVSTKLDEMDAERRRAKAQQLLEYAVSPEGNTRAVNGSSVSACVSLTGNYKDFHHDMPDSKFVSLFFEHGADAGHESARPVWARTLKAGRTYFSRQASVLELAPESTRVLLHNRRRWVAAVKALLAHGADPQLQVEIGGSRGGEGSTEVRPAIEIIRDTLDGEREYAEELILIEALACGREG